jgi:hypothetical protein
MMYYVALQVETFVDNDSISGAVRSSMAGVARRKSLQRVRSNLVAKVLDRSKQVKVKVNHVADPALLCVTAHRHRVLLTA